MPSVLGDPHGLSPVAQIHREHEREPDDQHRSDTELAAVVDARSPEFGVDRGLHASHDLAGELLRQLFGISEGLRSGHREHGRRLGRN